MAQTAVHPGSGRVVCENIGRLDLDYIERFGTYTRLHYEDRSFTNYEELLFAGQLARLLRNYGIGPGDRVITMMPNSPSLTASYQAVWTLGGAVIPVMPQWTPPEIAHVMQNSEAPLALTIPALAPRVAAAGSGIETFRHLLVFGESDVPGAVNILPQLDTFATVEYPVDRSLSDLAMLLYTSGTTAKPKGVMITHGNVFSSFESASRMNPDLPRGPMLHMLPLAHSFGVLMINLANAWGFSSVLLNQFDPHRAFEAIERHKVKYMPVVPAMLMYMLNHPSRTTFDTSSLYRITNGGAALPEPLRIGFERTFGCRVEQGYGLSESVAVATGYDDHTTYRPRSVGRTAPGVEAKILDENNEEVPPGGIGEICLRGRNIADGYWRDPAATDAALIDGWLHTGDIGYFDQDGFLYITDRKKDLIIKGGENISPREIEEALSLHPAVAEAAVIGVPDPAYGEEICAVVQLKPGASATEEEVRDHAAAHITKFKVPARVIFVPALPRNSTGKVSKRELRERMRRPETGD